MGEETKAQNRHSDYSLVGKKRALAIEKGLAEAKWYASPVPKDKMRELLERRDGPAVRDTLLWFALLFIFGACGLSAVGHLVGHPAVRGLRRHLRLHLRLPLARIEPRHGFQDRLDEQRPLRDRLVHGPARIDPLALEPHPPPQRHDHRRPRPGDRRAAPGRTYWPCSLKFFSITCPAQLLPQRAPALHRPADAGRADLHPGIGVRQSVPASPHLRPDLRRRRRPGALSPAASCR